MFDPSGKIVMNRSYYKKVINVLFWFQIICKQDPLNKVEIQLENEQGFWLSWEKRG
jgi:hypothetical protein